MAIPISWPSSEDVEDSYRSLDILLEQLLLTVRQVLAHRRQTQLTTPGPITRQRTHTIVGRTETTTSATNTDSSSPVVNHPRLPLPDLIPESNIDCEAPRRKLPTVPSMETSTSSVSTWAQVGADLRRIADAFRDVRNPNQNSVDVKSSRIKEISLLSILCPALGKSVWTTVALIVGWGIFSRTR